MDTETIFYDSSDDDIPTTPLFSLLPTTPTNKPEKILGIPSTPIFSILPENITQEKEELNNELVSDSELDSNDDDDINLKTLPDIVKNATILIDIVCADIVNIKDRHRLASQMRTSIQQYKHKYERNITDATYILKYAQHQRDTISMIPIDMRKTYTENNTYIHMYHIYPVFVGFFRSHILCYTLKTYF